jgi:CheY-like chemotaxis protein
MRMEPCVVLLGEDHENTRLAMRDLLELAGFAVFDFADGASLLEAIFTTRTPFVVVSDLWMPKLTAHHILDRLRVEGILDDVPFLVVSGDPGFFSKAYPDVPLFSKPLDTDALLLAVERLARRACSTQAGLSARLRAVQKKRQHR